MSARRWIVAGGAVGLAGLLAALVAVTRHSTSSQRVSTVGPPVTVLSSSADVARVPGLRAQRGRELARAEAAQPVGPLGLRGYRVDELVVDPPIDVAVEGRQVRATRALRLTVTGGPFAVRDLPAIIWVDEHELGVGTESRDRTELSVITFDVDALRTGATIAVAYGARRFALPQPMRLGR